VCGAVQAELFVLLSRIVPCARRPGVDVQLFNSDNPGEKDDWMGDLNRDSEEVLTGVMISSQLQGVKPLDRFQFERLGYFCVDTDSTPSSLVFNRTCALRDTYSDKR
jgi:glutaminyl-tRNA synthetase